MRPQSECYFCHGPSESRTSSGFAACRKCIRKTLIPFISEAIGPDELRRLVNGDDQADAGAGPEEPQQSGWNRKMKQLMAGAKRNGAAAGVPMGPIEFSANPIGQQLVLERALARQRGVMAPADLLRNIRRAGLKA
jgi:hypothetical protein